MNRRCYEITFPGGIITKTSQLSYKLQILKKTHLIVKYAFFLIFAFANMTVFAETPTLDATSFRSANAGAAPAGFELRFETQLKAVPALGGVAPRSTSKGLRSLMASAFRGAPEVSGAEARIDGEVARVDKARGRLLPNVSMAAEDGKGVLSNSGGDTRMLGYRSVSGQVVLPIYRPRLHAEVRGALVAVEDSRLALKEVQNEISFQVAAAYLEVVSLREDIRSLSEERDLVRAQQRVNARRLEGGIGSVTEVDESALRLLVIQTNLEAVTRDLSFQLAELRRLSGDPAADAVPLKEGVAIPRVVPQSLDLAQDSLRTANPTLNRALLAISSARENLSAQRADHLPTLDMQGYTDRGQNVSGGVYRNSSSVLSIVINLPIYSGGSINAAETEAAAQLRRTQHDSEVAERRLSSELNRTWGDFTKFEERVKANSEALALAMELAQRTRKSFDAGLRTNIDVLNAQRQISDVRKELIRARSGAVMNQIRILTLLDDLDDRKLEQLDGILDAD
ncbi:TolC family protein [uncultured Zoogloea sp.]|uniref:TolC family protein n=1 Tax=uncultured Zoogloea sp. TaxID=160237 RepID=UPI00263935BF|nr:TolC family protein [uncultured Zoogloea sp.]